MAVLTVLLLASFLGDKSDGPLASRTIAGNATASVLVDRGAAVGLDFRVREARSVQPADPSADRRALGQAAPRAWLEAQIQVPDESIAEPPQVLRDYFESRRDAIWAIVAALEKQPPEWIEPKDPGALPFPYLLPSSDLQKVLLALSLIEERDGHAIEAGRALEASWSLARPLVEGKLFVYSISVQDWQAAVLRKLKEPPLVWLGRMGGDDPWRRLLENIGNESEWRSDDSGSLPASDPFSELTRRAPDAIAEGLGKLPPCDAAALDEDELWRFADREIPTSSAPYAAEVRRMYKERYLPLTLGMVRRVARLSVDRELTLQILQLKLDRSARPDRRWPERLVNSASTVCPTASYGYRAGTGGMEIRFEGPVAEPQGGTVLPLSFRSEAPPVLTPTPGGGMIAPP